MRVVLVSPPFGSSPDRQPFIRSGRWTRVSRGFQNWYPIWLAYCTGLLQRRGHEVYLLDAEADRLSPLETLCKIRDFKPELVVVYFVEDSMENDLKFGELVSDMNLRVVFVGPSAEFLKEELLSRGIKLLARGEFDYTVLELTEGKSLEKIKGLSWLDEDTPYHNPQRELCTGEQLEKDFPFVTSVYKQFLDLDSYHQASFKHPFVDMFTGRGCNWGLCTFCLWAYGFNQGTRQYRMRRVEDVIEELKYIRRELPHVKQVFFQDETLPDQRIMELSCGILDSGLDVCWGGYARPDISYKTLKMAKKSGCRTLHVGFESRNKESLRAVRKGITVNRMEQFAEDTRKVGLKTSCNFILGLPHDTEDGIKDTVNWVKRKIRPHRVSFSYLQVYRGTPVHSWLRERGFLINDKYPNYPHLKYERILELEKWGLKEYYLKNPRWMIEQIKDPSEWGNLLHAAVGFFKFLKGEEIENQSIN